MAKKINRTTTLKFSAKHFVPEHTTSSDGKSLEDVYDIDFENDRIEEGVKSVVYRCRHKETGEERAVKVVKKSTWNDDANNNIKHEINLLRKMDHPNIVRSFSTFEDKKNYYIVMDYCKGGEMRDQIIRGTGMSEYYVAVMIKTLLSTINYGYQKHNVVHLGLRPENILLDGNRQVEQLKLIDFGNSIQTNKVKKLDRIVGSAAFLAPESLQFNNYSHKTDIWALGVVSFMALSGGSLPFDAETDRETLELILNSKEEVVKKEIFKNEEWACVSPDALDFISKMLSFEQFKRPTAKEALQHPWIERVTQAQVEVMQKRDIALAQQAMDNLFKFQAPSKLQQAALTFIASQCLTTFDKDEMESIYQAVDIGGTGKLSKADVKHAYAKYMYKNDSSNHHVLAEAELKKLFRQLSLSGSKTIEYSEFLIAALDEEKLLTEQNIQTAFETFDDDGDGEISEKDLKHAFKYYVDKDYSENDIAEYIRDKILKQIDTGNEGKITYSVFADLLRRTKNGSGRDLNAVSSDEEDDGGCQTSVDKMPISGKVFDQYRKVFERNLSM